MFVSILIIYSMASVSAANQDVLTTKSPGVKTAELHADGVVDLRRRASNQKSPLTDQDSDEMEKLMNGCGKLASTDIGVVHGMIRKYGADAVVNANYYSRTCLHYAAWMGNSKIIDLLVENGAEIDPKDSDGETPLRLAIQWQRYSSITLLLKFGASLANAKEAEYGQYHFDRSMEQRKVLDAIAKGQEVADDCKERNCSGNGKCQDAINDYNCLCDSGYAGKDCQFSGSIQRGSKLNLKMVNNASSVYGEKYAANKAIVEGGYYCSKKNAGLPVYWWMSFEESPVEIVSIKFEEKYAGAEFEFFACDDAKELCKRGRVLINGIQKEINGKEFDNGQNYHCYGLKITKLGAYQYASLMNFQYFVLAGPSFWF